MFKSSIIPLKINFHSDINSYDGFLSGKILDSKILIIGGAGTIGSNYIKKILNYNPAKITVVDNNENGLTELTRDLRSSKLLDYQPSYITYPVNLLSKTFDKIYNSDDWDIVANFAAHKHVRSEKDFISIEALLKNNVFGAIKLLELCEKSPPKYFFSVSTDKAANPVNIMGASKSLLEKLILSKMKKFRVSTARFANVAFSNGSLLDGFVNRLNKKQPLSCPSDIRRFFVTPEQSGEICMLSTFLGESGNIFFPKLDFNNDQFFFKEIALNFLKEKGLNPVVVNSEDEAKNFNFLDNLKSYPLFLFETDTSGEKKFEEFYTENENYNLDKYDSLGFIASDEIKISFKKVKEDLNLLFENPASNKLDIIKILKYYISGFNHIETGKHLDQKM